MIDLAKEEVTIKGTKFNIQKPLCQDAWDLLEVLRPCFILASDYLNFDMDEGKPNFDIVLGQALFKIVAGAPRDIIKETKDRLFNKIYWTTKDSPNPITISMDSEGAFNKLEPVHIYELIVRGLIINFRGSWDELRSRFRGLGDLNPTSILKTSTLSSETP